MLVKKFAEFALSGMVFEIQAKIQMATIFWWDKFFLKIGSATQQSWPKGENFWPPFLASEIFIETWKG